MVLQKKLIISAKYWLIQKNKNISNMTQEFLDGQQYVVDSVSYNSNHKNKWIQYKK